MHEVDEALDVDDACHLLQLPILRVSRASVRHPRSARRIHFQAVDRRNPLIRSIACAPPAEVPLLEHDPSPQRFAQSSSFFSKHRFHVAIFLLFGIVCVCVCVAQLRTQYALLRLNVEFMGASAGLELQFLEGLAQHWLSVLNSFADDSATNDAFYFHRAGIDMGSRSSANVVLLEEYGQSVLGLNMSWMSYYEQCRPLYCDVTKPNSRLSQSLTVAAQVGGLFPIALFLLRSLIWPLVAKLIGNK